MSARARRGTSRSTAGRCRSRSSPPRASARDQSAGGGPFAATAESSAILARASDELEAAHGVRLPATPRELLHNPGALNLVHTSRYFAGYPPYFDDSHRFVGPPVHDRRETVEFPFERLAEAAITHAGMIAARVPFVCLPLSADQPALAARAGELGATLIPEVSGISSCRARCRPKGSMSAAARGNA